MVGLNSTVVDSSWGSACGFAVPIDTLRGLVEQIMQHGRVLRPSLGITLAPAQVCVCGGGRRERRGEGHVWGAEEWGR